MASPQEMMEEADKLSKEDLANRYVLNKCLLVYVLTKYLTEAQQEDLNMSLDGAYLEVEAGEMPAKPPKRS